MNGVYALRDNNVRELLKQWLLACEVNVMPSFVSDEYEAAFWRKACFLQSYLVLKAIQRFVCSLNRVRQWQLTVNCGRAWKSFLTTLCCCLERASAMRFFLCRACKNFSAGLVDASFPPFDFRIRSGFQHCEGQRLVISKDIYIFICILWLTAPFRW